MRIGGVCPQNEIETDRGAVTTKPGFITGVLILTQRQTVLVGKQPGLPGPAVRGPLSAGRGTGWNEAEYEALGVPFAGRGRRITGQVFFVDGGWTL